MREKKFFLTNIQQLIISLIRSNKKSFGGLNRNLINKRLFES